MTSAVARLLGASGLLALVTSLLRRRHRRRHTLPPIPVVTAEPLVRALDGRGLTLATAESCSGGVLSALVTGVPGAGRVFRGGVIAYAGDLKEKLVDVPGELVDSYGAVSDPVARAMARGVRRRLGADVGIAVTGLIGGPDEGKPSGLVYVAAAGPGSAERCIELPDNRGPEGNREEAARVAFGMAQEMVG